MLTLTIAACGDDNEDDPIPFTGNRPATTTVPDDEESDDEESDDEESDDESDGTTSDAVDTDTANTESAAPELATDL